MIARPCLDCGRIVRNGSRCPTCRKRKDRQRGSATQRGYGAEWRRFSADLREMAGECSMCGATEDLTVDHIMPGVLDLGVRVPCRSCHGTFGRQWNRRGT